MISRDKALRLVDKLDEFVRRVYEGLNVGFADRVMPAYEYTGVAKEIVELRKFIVAAVLPEEQ